MRQISDDLLCICIPYDDLAIIRPAHNSPSIHWHSQSTSFTSMPLQRVFLFSCFHIPNSNSLVIGCTYNFEFIIPVLQEQHFLYQTSVASERSDWRWGLFHAVVVERVDEDMWVGLDQSRKNISAFGKSNQIAYTEKVRDRRDRSRGTERAGAYCTYLERLRCQTKMWLTLPVSDYHQKVQGHRRNLHKGVHPQHCSWINSFRCT